MSSGEIFGFIGLGFLTLAVIVTMLCAILGLEYEEFFYGIFMGLTFPFRYIYKKVKSWFEKKPKMYSASEIALISKKKEFEELNRLTEEFYLKFQDQYLKAETDQIVVYSCDYGYESNFPLETRIYRILSKDEKNLLYFMDFFRKKGWFIKQDQQERTNKKGRYVMSQEEGYKFTVSLTEIGE